MSRLACRPIFVPLDPEPLVERPPDRRLDACVIVPVRNEAATLARTIRALVQQVDLSGRPLDPARFEVIVLANNCTDGSAEVARRVARTHPRLRLHVVERTFPAPLAHVGTARRRLMDEAHRRLLLVGRPAGAICSTDGDTVVGPTWIAAIRAELTLGADAVGGRIVAERTEIGDALARAYHLRDLGYRCLASELESRLDPNPADPWPRHHQHFGASLAVRADGYARVGGLPPVRELEDVAFVRALLRHDARLRHSPLVRVVTSDRITGRVPVGLSQQLRSWAAMGREAAPLRVEAVRSLEHRWRLRRAVRLAWLEARSGRLPSAAALDRLAAELAVEASALRFDLEADEPFGALWERLEPGAGLDLPTVEIDHALAELRLRLASLRQLTPTASRLVERAA